MARNDLTEPQWRALAPHLPSDPTRGQPWSDHRKVINGILWRLRTGAGWREVPARYGPYQTCYDRFVRWGRDGTWQRILQALQAEADARGPSEERAAADCSRSTSCNPEFSPGGSSLPRCGQPSFDKTGISR